MPNQIKKSKKLSSSLLWEKNPDKYFMKIYQIRIYSNINILNFNFFVEI